MSVHKTLSEYSIDDETFEIFESVSSLVVDVPWKINLASPIQEKFLKETCFQNYESKIKSELSKKNITSNCTSCQVKCKVSENGFSFKLLVDKTPVLHCLFLGVDPEDNENDQNTSNTRRSRRKYKYFTLLLIHGKKTYEKIVLPTLEKLLSCQITTLLLSIRDYHWLLTISSHYIEKSKYVFDNLLHLIYKHPSTMSRKHKIIMCVEYDKVLALWNDIFNKFKISDNTISASMSEKLKTSTQEHFENIFTLDLSKLSLSEIHVEDILKVQINSSNPVICIENSGIVPVVLHFLFLMSYNQQCW